MFSTTTTDSLFQISDAMDGNDLDFATAVFCIDKEED